MSLTFLDAVNRVLRIGGIIRGDTDPITTFADLQHGSTYNLAIIAIQSTLTDLTAYYNFPAERASSTVTLSTGTRLYSLASDFVQFWEEDQFFFDTAQNIHIFEYHGGERRLAQEMYTYKTDSGYPSWWYYSEGATKQVGFYRVPTSTENAKVLTYDYEKDVIPVLATDAMPFLRDIEAYKFCDLAAVKFNALFTQTPREPSSNTEEDANYKTARATLLRLMTPNKASSHYGPTYR